ncbi:chorismate-binding protein [Lutimonas sp.]|uniref:chorismate-binding protein n=1 Tax=Lutimonas sp. TaxID=1872403 RepID=UPI003D9B4721
MSIEKLLKKIQQAKDEQLPFVIYRKPESDEVKVLIQKNQRLDYSDDFKSSGFVLAPFDTSKQAVVFEENNLEIFHCDISKELLADAYIFQKQPQITRDPDDQLQHMQLVQKGIDEIRKGSFVKAVLSRSESYIIKEVDVTAVFLRLMRKYPSAFVYVWYHPAIGIWSGASPELLLRTEGKNFQTMSLAGTQKYSGSVDVSWGEKEIKEQRIVTDHIVESLQGMPLELSDLYTRKAGDLLHLCNDIKGQLGVNTSLHELIEKLHPTAAICGLPKKEVRQFILREEGYDRSYYTGFLGELNMNDGKESRSNLFVNLRCMQLIERPNPQAIIYVGGGITLGSNPLLEWKETVDKSLIMKSVLES